MTDQSNLISSKKTLLVQGKLVDLSSPKVMGIINITPDSFYSGSRKNDEKQVLKTAGQMLNEGAFCLDIGGYSSRPGAVDISLEEELNRVLPIINSVKNHFPEALISIDTFRAEVAEQCVNEGASIVNDITGGDGDKRMYELIAVLGVPYVIMHMRGTPQTMAAMNRYDDLVKEVIYELQHKVAQCIAHGIKDIVVDPGFGFAKNIPQNFELLKYLDLFTILEHPLLVGLSRKSLIYKTLNTTPTEALNGTSVLNTIALMKGASILRVHDVKEAVECVKLYELAHK